MTEATETMEPESKNSAIKDGALRASLLDHVEIGCEAVLGSGSITIGRLNAMAKGDLLTLDRSPADPVDIRVNGKTIARGEIVTVDDRFAIRVTEIG